MTCGNARRTYRRTRAGCRPALAAALGFKFAPVKLLKLHRALHDALSDHRSVDPNEKTQHTELGESRACVASVKVVAGSDERRSAAAGCRRGRGLPPPCRRRRAVTAPPPPRPHRAEPPSTTRAIFATLLAIAIDELLSIPRIHRAGAGSVVWKRGKLRVGPETRDTDAA